MKLLVNIKYLEVTQTLTLGQSTATFKRSFEYGCNALDLYFEVPASSLCCTSDTLTEFSTASTRSGWIVAYIYRPRPLPNPFWFVIQ